MALKQQDALLTGLATAAVVITIYQHNMPAVAQVRASKPGNQHVSASRQQAAIIGVVIVAGISWLAKDPTVWVVAGTTLVALDISQRMANATDNVSGKIPAAAPDATAAPTDS